MTWTKDTVFGRELIALMQEAAATARGEADAVGTRLPPGGINIPTFRERCPLTRPAFACKFGLAVAAMRDWEQALRRPDFVARVLLMVIARNPVTVAQAVVKVQVT